MGVVGRMPKNKLRVHKKKNHSNHPTLREIEMKSDVLKRELKLINVGTSINTNLYFSVDLCRVETAIDSTTKIHCLSHFTLPVLKKQYPF